MIAVQSLVRGPDGQRVLSGCVCVSICFVFVCSRYINSIFLSVIPAELLTGISVRRSFLNQPFYLKRYIDVHLIVNIGELN